MTASRGRKRRRWKRPAIVLGVVAALVVALWVAVRVVASPARVARLVRERLGDAFGCDVRVGWAEFHLLSGTTIRDLELREQPDAAPWASVGGMSLRHRVAPLLRGRLELSSVRVVEPRLVVNDASLARLARLAKAAGPEAPSPPAVVVERGEVSLERTERLPRIGPITLGPITLALTNPDERARLIAVTGGVETPAGALALDAQVDRTRSRARVRLTTSALALDKLPRGWLPEPVPSRREFQELAGVVSGDVDGSVSWASERPDVAYVARLRFDDVSFQPQDIALPVREAAGEATLRPGRIAVADAFGRLGTSRFELEELHLILQPVGGCRHLSFSGSIYDVPLDASVRAALPKPAQETWDSLGVESGRASVDVRYSVERRDEPIVALDIELRDVLLKPQDARYPLPPLAGRVRYDSTRSLVTLDDIEGKDDRLTVELDGSVSLASKPPAFRLHLRADGVPLDERLRGALEERLAATWKQLGIAGGSLGADLVASGRKGQELRLTGTLDLHDVQARPDVFPYALPPLSGGLRLGADRQVVLSDVAGSLGELSVRVAGSIDAKGDDPTLRLRIALAGLPVDNALYQALPKAARDALAKVDLKDGSVGAELTVQGSAKQPDIVTRITLEGCSAKPEAFPYRLSSLRGAVEWNDKAKTLRLDSASGLHGAARLTLDGRFDLAEAERPKTELTVEGTGVALDDDLRAALPKEWLETWQRHRPSGHVDLALRLSTSAQGQLLPRGTLVLRECGVEAPQLPRRLEDLSGTVELDADVVKFDNVVGRAGAARLRADGVYRTGKGRGRLESLSLVATELELDESLVAALPADVRDALEAHAPEGTVDLRLDYLDDGKDPPRTRVAAVLRGLAFRVQADGPRLTQLQGEVRSDGQSVVLAGVRGRLGSAGVELDGRVALKAGAGETAVQVRLPSFQLDPAFIRELPEKHAAALQRLGPKGLVQATGTIGSPTPKASPQLTTGSLSFEDLSLETRPRIDRLYGTASYTAAPADDAAAAGRVTLHVARARFAGLSLQDLSATCRLASDLLEVSDADWSMYGGRVTGQVQVRRADPPSYEGQLEIAHLDLESLVAALGEPQNAPSGWLRGTIRFKGQGRELAGLELWGAGKVDRGHLYDLPLIVSVWSVLALQLPGKGSVTDAHVEFRIRDGVLHIDHFLLTGESAPVDVRGSLELKPGVRLEDQRIDLLFTAARQRKFLDTLPVIGWVKSQSYDRLTRHFLQARVTGTLADHKVQYLLKPVVEPIGEFWALFGRLAAEAAGAVAPKRPGAQD